MGQEMLCGLQDQKIRIGTAISSLLKAATLALVVLGGSMLPTLGAFTDEGMG